MSDPIPAKRPVYIPVTVSVEQLNALEELHGDILVLKGTEKAPWLAVLKRPDRKTTLQYKQSAKRDSTTANEQLIRAICVFPDVKTPEFERQLDRWPLLPDGIAATEEFKEFLGLVAAEQVK